MPTRAWFPTHIYASPLLRKGNDEFARALLADCEHVRQQDEVGRQWCRDNYPEGYTSYGTQRRLNRALPQFAELQRKIWPHVQHFARRIDMDLQEASLAMLDCWVNIMAKGAVHPMHVHPGAVFSGTYYVTAPQGCASIRFEDPRIEHFKNAPPQFEDCRPANRRHVSYGAKAGQLVLFESWLRHEVPCNPTEEERVSISFNYAWV